MQSSLYIMILEMDTPVDLGYMEVIFIFIFVTNCRVLDKDETEQDGNCFALASQNLCFFLTKAYSRL